MKKNELRIIPLGGLGEIGKNFTVFETKNDILIVDCGLAFPESNMLGIDFVIPDFSYVIENRDKIRGILITHGHEDHIGGIPYLLEKINVPIYATRLTIGILEHKLIEKRIKNTQLNIVKAGQLLTFGTDFVVELINVNHSIADSLALAINTPAGIIMHTGDFKIDLTPLGGEVTDITRFGEYGRQGVKLLMMDSTNAEIQGKTNSERTVKSSFEKMFDRYRNYRITIATFSSNIYRIQSIFDISAKYGRKVAITGRSMLNTLEIAMKLNYIHVPDNTLISIDDVPGYRKEEVTIITTGSQGEPMSALYRMALEDHSKIHLDENDVILLSSHPIPGNEKLVNEIINKLYDKGCKVVSDKIASIHVSGHACQDELKLIFELVRPEYFMPVHGETKHLIAHKKLAQWIGIPEDHIFIGENGKPLQILKTKIGFLDNVKSGEVFVDGLRTGEIGPVVIKDRQILSESGVVIASIVINKKTKKLACSPNIVSRGFVVVNESADFTNSLRQITEKEVLKTLNTEGSTWVDVRKNVKNILSKYIYNRTKCSPMILPIITGI